MLYEIEFAGETLVVDTHTPAHVFVAAMVRQANWDRDNVQMEIDRVKDRIERVERYLANGTPLNQLGELQGGGPAVDAAVARYETSRRAAELAVNTVGDDMRGTTVELVAEKAACER